MYVSLFGLCIIQVDSERCCRRVSSGGGNTSQFDGDLMNLVMTQKQFGLTMKVQFGTLFLT